MTDVLDRADGPELPPLEPAAPSPSPSSQPSWPALGLVHLAMAPSHLGSSAVDGIGFLAAGWLQLALAVVVVVRPSRAAFAAAAALSAACVGAWAVSRTVGLPVGEHAGEAESVAFVDGATVVLEVAALFLAVGLLARPHADRSPRAGLAVAGVLGALALATAAVASPSAREHGGHDDAHVEEEAHGHSDTEADDLGFTALANGQMGDHHHGEGTGETATEAAEIDAETAGELAQQLALTAPLVERYPTLGAARADGYRQAGPFSPGLGIHYNKGSAMNADGLMDPEDIANPTLIFDGTGDDAPLAGFMYMAYQETEPEGFVGPLDRWHYHTQVCIVFGPDGIDTPFGADLTGVTQAMCEAEGGTLLDFTGYMVHVWTVPGYESELGTFSDLNPKLTCEDGTYHTVPIAEIGDADSTCRDVANQPA